MNTEEKNKIIELYEEALLERNPFIRKLRLAFCLTLAEDLELLKELGKL